MRFVALRAVVLVVLLVGGSAIVRCQSLDLSNVVLSGNPNFRTDYIARDANGVEYTNLTRADFRIVEHLSNGRTVDVSSSVNHNCVKTSEPVPVSLLIVLDRSSSMDEYVSVGNSRLMRIEIAKNALRDLFTQMNIVPGTRICVIGFNARSSMVCDWTSDRSLLISRVNAVTLDRGTNYRSPFFVDPFNRNDPKVFDQFAKCDPAIAKRLIFITDGEPNPPLISDRRHADSVIALATAQNVQVHAVSIDIGITYPALAMICSATGGTHHAGESASLATMLDAARTAGGETHVCTIEWTSSAICGPADGLRNTTITLLRGANPTQMLQYQGRVVNTTVPIQFSAFPRVTQSESATISLQVPPPQNLYGDVNQLTINITYPLRQLFFDRARTSESDASITAQTETGGAAEAEAGLGRLTLLVAVRQPFDSTIAVDLDFNTLLASDTIAHITAELQTDYPCAVAPTLNADLVVPHTCAGIRRVVALGDAPFRLAEIHPNPANDVITLGFALGYATGSSFEIVDALGHVVRTFVYAATEAPSTTASSARSAAYEVDIYTGDLGSGAYVLRMVAGHYTDSRLFHVIH